MKHVLRGGNGLAKLCVQECMPNATYTVTFSAESSSSRDPLPFHPMRCAKPDPVESKGPVEAVVPVVIVGRERFSGFGAGANTIDVSSFDDVSLVQPIPMAMRATIRSGEMPCRCDM